jgi:uridine kinase
MCVLSAVNRRRQDPTSRSAYDPDVTDDEIDDVVARIRRLPGKRRLVAIDGPGGSGKTTFAGRLSRAARGARSQCQRYDWPSETLAEWLEVDPAPIVIIEGVTAGRAEWVEHLDFVIWIDTPRDVRLDRAVERDGPGALDDWEVWMAEEDAHYERDPTRQRADLIIDGTR